MKIKINQEFSERILVFLDTLKKSNSYGYFPAKRGLTDEGKSINLGFSCFSLKCFFILDEWKQLDGKYKNDWINYINSFQSTKISNFPDGSFIDLKYLDHISKVNITKEVKRFGKKILNKRYKNKKEEIDEFIRAETKQAISSLYQVGARNEIKYSNEILNSENLVNYLDSLDWTKPWTSGAQFSGLCVFLETQEKDNDNYIEKRKDLISFSNMLIDQETGCYFKGKVSDSSELINGTMKILTGLDWLNHPVHKPESLIDTCLKVNINGKGCDIVDIVYVLYKCMLQTSYKKKQIISYLDNVEMLIGEHFHKDSGGFSYSKNQSQLYYYGLEITNGSDTADIHGTTLLLWAYSMINFIKENNEIKFNILKP
tara:strand:+ start:23237 stop:24349 length:1113 start_codon:yes stop_codon:yes gene_type:complete